MQDPHLAVVDSLEGLTDGEQVPGGLQRTGHARPGEYPAASAALQSRTLVSRGIVKTSGSACHALLPAVVLLTTLIFATVLAVVKFWAASGAAGLQESNGDEFRRGSQSVSTPDQPHSRRAS